MATYDLDTAQEILRNAVLDAMDTAANRIFGTSIKTNCAGAMDKDLPKLFAAIDVQLETLSARYNHPLYENYIGTPKHLADREVLFKLTGHKFDDEALRTWPPYEKP